MPAYITGRGTGAGQPARPPIRRGPIVGSPTGGPAGYLQQTGGFTGAGTGTRPVLNRTGGTNPLYRDQPQSGTVAYGNPAQGGYIGGSTGPGNRRFYDDQRNNLMARYNQGSGGLQQQYDSRVRTLGNMLRGFGNQQRADAMQRGQNLGSQVQNSFTNRGLSGSTLAGAGQAMVGANTANELGRINESIQDRMTGLAERTTGDALGYGERALQGQIGLGQSNIRDSRGDFESDRGFGEGQFQSDRAFGRGTYENDRNFNRGVYEDDRNFGNRNFESDRDFNQRRNESDRDYAMRMMLMQQDQSRWDTDRNDRLALERLGFMERRNDTYPSLDQLYAYAQEGGYY